MVEAFKTASLHCKQTHYYAHGGTLWKCARSTIRCNDKDWPDLVERCCHEKTEKRFQSTFGVCFFVIVFRNTFVGSSWGRAFFRVAFHYKVYLIQKLASSIIKWKIAISLNIYTSVNDIALMRCTDSIHRIRSGVVTHKSKVKHTANAIRERGINMQYGLQEKSYR